MKKTAALLLLSVAFLAACPGPDASSDTASGQLLFEAAGRLENDNINEASGLARSQREPGVLWTMNDSGKPLLYAIGKDGGERILRCIGGPSCVAKNRYGIVEELPLSWAAFIQALSNNQSQGVQSNG